MRRPLRLAGFPSKPSTTARWVRDRNFPEGRRIYKEIYVSVKRDAKRAYIPKASYTHRVWQNSSKHESRRLGHNWLSRRGHVPVITCTQVMLNYYSGLLCAVSQSLVIGLKTVTWTKPFSHCHIIHSKTAQHIDVFASGNELYRVA